MLPPTIPAPPLARSLGFNVILDEGTIALADVLKESQITHLKCAAPSAFAFLSVPIETLALL